MNICTFSALTTSRGLGYIFFVHIIVYVYTDDLSRVCMCVPVTSQILLCWWKFLNSATASEGLC